MGARVANFRRWLIIFEVNSGFTLTTYSHDIFVQVPARVIHHLLVKFETQMQ